ncbi:MAG TPA: ribonucleotide reductase N-terminal alpha domain-containing protein, partial [bacterium]|nr:ribonucleotide reductase N-terminal alpha domain-containing protein [bacterium]
MARKKSSASDAKEFRPAELSENALCVLQRRYLLRDKMNDIVETPQDLFRRVASNMALADRKYSPKPDIDAIAER